MKRAPLRVIAGLALLAAGVCATIGCAPPLADYTYAILWWGLLLIVDAYNERRHGLSLWRGRAGRFLGVTIPISVLFWLLFELLNLAAPQWRYRGRLGNLHAQVLFGFVSFATVIPIMVESYWLITGEFCLPAAFSRGFRHWKWLSILCGIALAAIPLFNGLFWFNQGIWLAPAFVLLPFTDARPCPRPGRFVAAIAASGLLAGFFWELLNFQARTHWEYLILPRAPHLFQMPLPGYIGFIPFALTALIAYERQTRIPARAVTVLPLYGAALALLYLLTGAYVQRGLWLFN